MLTQTSLGSGTVTLNTPELINGGTTVKLSFAASDTTHTQAGDAYHSLVDGRYQLQIVTDKITSFGASLDGDANGFASGAYTSPTSGDNEVYRLFGDGQGNNGYGDKDVDSMDFDAFLATYGSTGAAFDFDGDGDVDTADYAAFKARYGVIL